MAKTSSSSAAAQAAAAQAAAEAAAEAERQRVEQERAEVRRLAQELAGEVGGTVQTVKNIADEMNLNLTGVSSDIAYSRMHSMADVISGLKSRLESV